VLQVSGLRKRFGSREVLGDVGFSVRAGQVYGLLGANGSGKTTTMNIIGGLLDPDAGTVTVAGDGSARSRRRHLGIAPQEIALYPSLTCDEHLRFFARLYSLTPREGHTAIAAVIGHLGLGPYRQARAVTLSGGWKRRLNLAVALVHEPRVVLLDEPTAGLDVEGQQLVWQHVRRLAARGAAVLLSTHLLDEAEQLCHRLGILVNGRIVAQGSLTELCRLVPAVEVATVECGNEELLRARAAELGIQVRTYAGGLSLLLRERTTVAALAERLGNVGLRSLALHPVSLIHVFLEHAAG